MMMCDMMCYCALENPLLDNENLLKIFPKLEALRKRIRINSKLAEYFKKRKDVKF